MIYFDNAATSFPKPQNVQLAAADAVRVYGGNPGRSGHRISMRVSERVFRVRQQAAQYFGAEPENVIFTLNCTMALNMAIKGVIGKTGHLITSSLEHNSVIRPIDALSRQSDVTYSVAEVVEEDPEATVQNFRKRIRADTKAIVCTYASNVSGTVLPIRELGKLCQKKGLVFSVDAAQAAGVFPIRIGELGIHCLCAAAHKGLYATTGTGLLILQKGVELQPLLEGGTGSNSLELSQPDFLPDRLESGTINTVGVLSLGAGFDFLEQHPSIYPYEMALCGRVYNEMKKMPGITLVAKSFRLQEKAPLVSFNFDGIGSAEAAAYLSDRGFALRGGLHCAGLAHRSLGTVEQGAVRFSPSSFNNTRQVSAFLEEVKKIQKNGQLRG